jgi:hypothetical protein
MSAYMLLCNFTDQGVRTIDALIAGELRMGDIKAGEPFGLEANSLVQIDWNLALKRVMHDVRSDFIYAPQRECLVNNASQPAGVNRRPHLSSSL